MGVGSLILEARASAGFSQAQLAKKIGTSQPMIARWESGSQLPSVRSLLRIAEASGFDLALALRKQGSVDGELQILSWARAVQPRRKKIDTRPQSRTKRRSL